MKYSKIIKEYLVNKINYLFVLVVIILPIMLGCCFSLVFKETMAWFSGNTAVLQYPYNVYYISNWPDDSLGSEHTIGYGSFRTYVVLGNQMFVIPEGYEFVNWNTLRDGTGIEYQENDTMTVREDVTLYAQWNKIVDDGIEDNEDETESDNVDDSLGDDENVEDGTTSGDDDSVDQETDGDADDSSDDVANEGTNTGSGGIGTGSGTSGSGTGSSGGGASGGTSSGSSSSGSGTSNGSSNSGTGSSNNSSNSHNGSSSSDNDNKNGANNEAIHDKNENISKTYTFKFISDNKEFAVTNCDVLEDSSCELLFPTANPIKEGYIFIGWSLSNLCSESDIITKSMKVDSNKTYYACFEINNDTSDNGNEWIYLVISIWIIAGILIYFAIKRFKKNEKKEEID